MLLKVGELAQRSGLTVRTLHHYDAIGLLKPSARSEAGYRLYDRGDVARLHAIQSLRHLGMKLDDMAEVLAGAGAAPGALLQQQIDALAREISRATELKGRLELMRDGLVAGAEPDMSDWLDTLGLMTTYGKYFSSAELKRIFEGWKSIQEEWIALKAEMRAAMERGFAPDALEVQPLVNRWMGLVLHWMGGDFPLIERWGAMFRNEPSAHGRNHAPEGDMLAFVDQAIKLRQALVAKYLDLSQLQRLGRVPLADWQALEARVQRLLGEGAAPDSAAARQAVRDWDGLIDRVTSGDAELRRGLQAAWAAEPLLQAGSNLSAPVREYLARSRATS